MKERNWDVSEVDSSSLGELAELGGAVSGRDSEVANESFLRWQYYNNPAGDVVIWVARDRNNSKLAGSYSVIPLWMKIDDAIVTGSLSMNTQTHPDYRKQGIFKTLAEKTFESCKANNIPLTIGLPNANSYPGFTGALKFADIGSRHLFIKPFNARFIVNKLTKSKMISKFVNPLANIGLKVLSAKSLLNRSIGCDIDVIESKSFGSDFDDFWNKISSEYRNIVVRDSKFLNWRFVTCPTRKYVTFKAVVQDKIVGYIVISVDKHHTYDCRVAFIVDLVVDPKINKAVVYNALMSKAEELALTNKADFVGMHVLSHSECCNVLNKRGYIDVPNRFIGGSQAFIVRPHLGRYSNDNQLMDCSNWFLMDGDNDRP